MAKKKPNVTKVLLCEDIESLGWLGDVVEVKMGYARNFLIPQGLAKKANEVNIKAISDERDHRAEQRKSERIKLEELVTAILGTETANLAAGAAGEGAEVVVAAKANEQGHLFGSVSGRQIAANLREQGFAVPDDAVQLAGIGYGDRHSGGRYSGGIKEVGTHEVTLKFADDLSCKVRVVVVAESPTLENGSPDSRGETPGAGAETSTLGNGNRDSRGEAPTLGNGNRDSRGGSPDSRNGSLDSRDGKPDSRAGSRDSRNGSPDSRGEE